MLVPGRSEPGENGVYFKAECYRDAGLPRSPIDNVVFNGSKRQHPAGSENVHIGRILNDGAVSMGIPSFCCYFLQHDLGEVCFGCDSPDPIIWNR